MKNFNATIKTSHSEARAEETWNKDNRSFSGVQEDKAHEQGRSMVEMLGVLAVIGVLTAGGVMGYKYAMDKHRSNEILDGVSKRAITIQSQLLGGSRINLDEFEEKIMGAYPVSYISDIGYVAEFGIKVTEMSKEVCEKTVESDLRGTKEVTGDMTCANATNALMFIFDANGDTAIENRECSRVHMVYDSISGKCVCDDGYHNSDGICIENDCSEYTEGICPDDATCDICQAAEKKYYTITACTETGKTPNSDGSECIYDCTIGNKRCNGTEIDFVEECTSAGWVRQEDCSLGCYSFGTDAYCKECNPDDTTKFCNDDDNVGSCDADGFFVEDERCDHGCYPSPFGASCKECDPNDTTKVCYNDNVSFCDTDGFYSKEKDCSNGCADGQCLPDVGTLKCSDDDTKVLEFSTSWAIKMTCPSGKICYDENDAVNLTAGCYSCLPQDVTCENNQHKHCTEDGEWEVLEDCVAGCSSNHVQCETPEVGTKACTADKGQVQQFDGTTWTVIQTCDVKCYDGDSNPRCVIHTPNISYCAYYSFKGMDWIYSTDSDGYPTDIGPCYTGCQTNCSGDECKCKSGKACGSTKIGQYDNYNSYTCTADGCGEGTMCEYSCTDGECT